MTHMNALGTIPLPPMLLQLRVIISVAILIAAFWGCGPAPDTLEQSRLLSVASTHGTAPTTAIDPESGTVHISWFDVDEDAEAVVRVARLAPGDSVVSSAVRVNPADVTVNAHPQAPAQVAVGPGGVLYVAWSTRQEIEGRRFPSSNLVLARSLDGGRTFQPPVFVNDDAQGVPSSHTFHDLAVGPDGAVYVAWLDSRESRPHDAGEHHGAGSESSGTDVRIARSVDGGRTFSPGTIVARGSCQCCRTSLFVDEHGQVYLAWRHLYDHNIRDIALATSIDRGDSFSEPRRIHADEWQIDGCPHSGPSLTVDADRAIHVSWYTGGDNFSGIRYASSSDGGRRFTEPQLIRSRIPIASARLAASDGTPVWIAWEDPLEKRIHVSATGESVDVSSDELTFDGTSPALAAAAEIRSIVWQNNGSIHAYIDSTTTSDR